MSDRALLALPVIRPHDKMPLLESSIVRRGARVDESTCLESMRPGNGTVGSNPTLSAIKSAESGVLSRQIDEHRCVSLCTSARIQTQDSMRRIIIGAGPCATEPCEPRQVRKEATVSGQFVCRRITWPHFFHSDE